MERGKIRFFVFFLLFVLSLALCFGEDERSKPVEVYVLFDNSISMRGSEQEAAAWLSGHVADSILQAGDFLTIWSVGDAPVQEFSGTVNGPESISDIKAVLSSIQPKNSAGNYEAAFGELQKRAVLNSQYAYSYIILVTGISGQNTSLFNAKAADILRYSRSEDFPGWKVMVIGFGIEQKIKSAAAAYMSSQG